MSDQTAIDRERWKKLEAIEHSGQGVAMFASDFRWLMAAARELEKARTSDQRQFGLRVAAELRAEKAEAEQARLRAALAIAAEAHCSLRCPSVFKSPSDPRHCDACVRIAAALAGAPEGTAHACACGTTLVCPDIGCDLSKVEAPEGTAAEPAAKEKPTQHWSVTVERNGENVVTVESNCLSGRDLSAEDERVVRIAGENLMSFIGPSPAPPAAPLHAALRALVEKWRREAAEMHTDVPEAISRRAIVDATRLRVWAEANESHAERIEALLASPAVPSSPTPEASELCNGNGIIVCGHRKGHDGPHDFWHVEEDE